MHHALGHVGRAADYKYYKSAIRQIENLRYGGLADRHFQSQTCNVRSERSCCGSGGPRPPGRGFVDGAYVRIDESAGSFSLSPGATPGKLAALVQQVNLGIIGGGTVGGGVFQALQRNGPLMASRLGVALRIVKIAVRDVHKPRAVKIPRTLLTSDWTSVVNDPQVNLIVELMGGTTAARTVTLRALELGKPVVTANKALLSAHGEELFEAAQSCGTNLYYEASVAGGIPIIKVLREALIGNRITRLYGIVNGTCNYILTRMKLEGADFQTVLAEAQRLGYAEAEPSLDVDGYDALHKIGILASLAHGFWVNPKHIYVEGIRGITALDIKFAGQLGYTIKLLGIVKKVAMAGTPNKGWSPVQVSV
jgi:homoserine dehydrogenase